MDEIINFLHAVLLHKLLQCYIIRYLQHYNVLHSDVVHIILFLLCVNFRNASKRGISGNLIFDNAIFSILMNSEEDLVKCPYSIFSRYSTVNIQSTAQLSIFS